MNNGTYAYSKMATDLIFFYIFLISPLSLVSMCKIQKNIYSKMRLRGLININIKTNKAAAILE